MKMLTVSLMSAAVLAAAPLAQATTVEYFGQDEVNGVASVPRPNANDAQSDFLSGLQGVETEDFESFATGSFTTLDAHFGSDTATITGTAARIQTSGAGTFPTSGSKYISTSSSAGGEFTISFSSPQAAFGFFGTDIGDVGGQLSLELDLANGGTRSFDVPHGTGADAPGNGAVLFYGLIGTTDADAFTSVHFFDSINNSGEEFGFDDLTIGRRDQVVLPPNPGVPSPAALPAGLIMLTGLLAKKRRSRTRV